MSAESSPRMYDGGRADHASRPWCAGDQLHASLTDTLNRGFSTDQEATRHVAESTAFATLPFNGEAFQCVTCEGPVSILNMSADAPACVVSRSCEEFFVERYPGFYTDDSGNPVAEQLPCTNCSVVQELEPAADSIAARIVAGVCEITLKGDEFRRTGMATLNKALNSRATRASMPDPEDFDGEGGRPEQQRMIRGVNTDRLPTVGTPYQEDMACDGEYLGSRTRSGRPAHPGEYECPRSDETGRHCLSPISVDELGQLAVVVDVEPQAWQRHCLMRTRDAAPTDGHAGEQEIVRLTPPTEQ